MVVLRGRHSDDPSTMYDRDLHVCECMYTCYAQCYVRILYMCVCVFVLCMCM